MYRFIAVMWDEKNPSQQEASKFVVARARERFPDLESTELEKGFSLFHERPHHSGAGVHWLTANSGCVVGQLFRRDSAATVAPSSFAERDSQLIASSSGQHLLENYWGCYVAFIRETAAGAAHIIRDPSGGLSCLLTSYSGVQVAFSRMDDCILLGTTKLSVNWKFLHAFLTGRDPQPAVTALNGVEQLRQGERVTISRKGDRVRQLAWNPTMIAIMGKLDDSRLAIEQARETALMCTAAWAKRYENIVLRYSAGFDSNIVLSCLRHAKSRHRITCLHYFDPPAAEPELEYLHRAMAAATDSRREEFELLLTPRSHEQTRLDLLTKVRPFAFPQHYRNRLTAEPQDSAIAREREAALFDGVYGNQLFLTDTLFASLDYLFDHPNLPPKGTHAPAAEEPLSVLWAAFSNVLRLGLLDTNRRRALDVAEHRLLNPGLIEALNENPEDYLGCYWSQHVAYGAPGKIRHLRMMCLPANMNAAHLIGDETHRVTPLISQPLMELFLRIPTYVLNHGGMDRGIARAAFSSSLPSELLEKSMVEIGHRTNQSDVHRIVLRCNEPFLFERLLEGRLSKEGLINRALAERDLIDLREGRALANIDLLEIFLDAEVWLSSVGAQ